MEATDYVHIGLVGQGFFMVQRKTLTQQTNGGEIYPSVMQWLNQIT